MTGPVDVVIGSVLHRRLVNRAVRIFLDSMHEDVVPRHSLVFEFATVDPNNLIATSYRRLASSRLTVDLDLSICGYDDDETKLAHQVGVDCDQVLCATCMDRVVEAVA